MITAVRMLKYLTLLKILALWAGTVSANKKATVGGHSKKVVCYWGTWANYRPKEGKFTPESVDGSLCTHLIYSFAGLDGSKNIIKSLDTWMDLEKDYGLAGFKKATDLKKKWPHLKVMIAIGGWNEGSVKYSKMAKDPKSRSTFVNSTLDFLKKHKFDGLDLDWEYPSKRGGAPEDKKNFVLLTKDLKEAFLPHKYLLTAAIGAGKATIDISYDVASMYKYLDLVNVMAYDLHGKWDKVTGHNAPIRPRPDEQGGNKFLNIEYIVSYLIKKGAHPEKTALGVPLYGRSFLLTNSANNHIGAKARATSFAGPLTREQGFLGYNEICKELSTANHSWTVVWEKCHMAPYMVKGDRWVSYDDERSARLKANIAFEHKLGGVMVWSIETDDFNGFCAKDPEQGGPYRYPMLKALNIALSDKERGEEVRLEEEDLPCDPQDYEVKHNVPVIEDNSVAEAPVADQETAHQPPPPSGGNSVCVKPNEPNPDPTDCSQFYLCANGVPHLLSCRPGTLYSPALMTCDHAFNVVCDAKPQPVDSNSVPSSDVKPSYKPEPSQPWTPPYKPPVNEIDSNDLESQRFGVFKEEKEEDMSGEKVVIVILILILLAILAILCWCFRFRIKEFAKPHLEKIDIQRIRKPSTVSLLQAYKRNKIRWPSAQPSQKSSPSAPPAPPRDYATNISSSASQSHSKLPGPPNIPLPSIPDSEEPAQLTISPAPSAPPKDYNQYSVISINSVPQPPPRNRRRDSITEDSTA